MGGRPCEGDSSRVANEDVSSCPGAGVGRPLARGSETVWVVDAMPGSPAIRLRRTGGRCEPGRELDGQGLTGSCPSKREDVRPSARSLAHARAIQPAVSLEGQRDRRLKLVQVGPGALLEGRRAGRETGRRQRASERQLRQRQQKQLSGRRPRRLLGSPEGPSTTPGWPAGAARGGRPCRPSSSRAGQTASLPPPGRAAPRARRPRRTTRPDRPTDRPTLRRPAAFMMSRASPGLCWYRRSSTLYCSSSAPSRFHGAAPCRGSLRQLFSNSSPTGAFFWALAPAPPSGLPRLELLVSPPSHGNGDRLITTPSSSMVLPPSSCCSLRPPARCRPLAAHQQAG